MSSSESTSRFISSASPVLTRLTSSFTCQAIFVIIAALSIYYPFTLSPQSRLKTYLFNKSFHVNRLPWTAFVDDWTGSDLSCSSAYYPVGLNATPVCTLSDIKFSSAVTIFSRGDTYFGDGAADRLECLHNRAASRTRLLPYRWRYL